MLMGTWLTRGTFIHWNTLWPYQKRKTEQRYFKQYWGRQRPAQLIECHHFKERTQMCFCAQNIFEKMHNKIAKRVVSREEGKGPGSRSETGHFVTERERGREICYCFYYNELISLLNY